MKKIFFFCLTFTVLASRLSGAENAIKEIEATINQEVEKIYSLQKTQGTSDELLWLYNDLGISYFFRGDQTRALSIFDDILREKYSKQDTAHLLVGAALWGKAICHACLDQGEEFAEDIRLLQSYFQNAFSANKHTKSQNAFQAKVEFADPNENISAAECRSRVKGCAEKLRLFIAPLIRDTAKRAIFVTFINALEEQGMYCCRDGSIWTTCVTPILEKLQKWKVIGIPDDPAWD